MIRALRYCVSILLKPSPHKRRGKDTTHSFEDHKMEIKPNPNVMSHRTGSLHGITYNDIYDRLGFPSNVMDDEAKVAYSWGFTVDGRDCAIWDWKGSHNRKIWSVYGPTEVFDKLFGKAYHGGNNDL
jgi:hypothetical protein